MASSHNMQDVSGSLGSPPKSPRFSYPKPAPQTPRQRAIAAAGALAYQASLGKNPPTKFRKPTKGGK